MGSHKISSKAKAPKAANCILVLWGEYFDEAAATVFTVTLRQAGLCVKVVGINGLLAAGRNGLALHADIVLSEVTAWMHEVFCLVLPCSRAAVKRLENDPRIHELFAGAAQNRAKFVVHDEGVGKDSILHLLTIPDPDILPYANVENLRVFAKELATTLLYTEKSGTYCYHLPLTEPIGSC